MRNSCNLQTTLLFNQTQSHLMRVINYSVFARKAFSNAAILSSCFCTQCNYSFSLLQYFCFTLLLCSIPLIFVSFLINWISCFKLSSFCSDCCRQTLASHFDVQFFSFLIRYYYSLSHSPFSYPLHCMTPLFLRNIFFCSTQNVFWFITFINIYFIKEIPFLFYQL